MNYGGRLKIDTIRIKLAISIAIFPLEPDNALLYHGFFR